MVDVESRVTVGRVERLVNNFVLLGTAATGAVVGTAMVGGVGGALKGGAVGASKAPPAEESAPSLSIPGGSTLVVETTARFATGPTR